LPLLGPDIVEREAGGDARQPGLEARPRLEELEAVRVLVAKTQEHALVDVLHVLVAGRSEHAPQGEAGRVMHRGAVFADEELPRRRLAADAPVDELPLVHDHPVNSTIRNHARAEESIPVVSGSPDGDAGGEESNYFRVVNDHSFSRPERRSRKRTVYIVEAFSGSLGIRQNTPGCGQSRRAGLSGVDSHPAISVSPAN